MPRSRSAALSRFRHARTRRRARRVSLAPFLACAGLLALHAAPAAAQSAPQPAPRPLPSHVTLVAGMGSWLPERHHPLGWNDDGSRALLGVQVERPFRASPWAWSLGLAGAVVPGACADRCAEGGVLVDAAVLRRALLPGRFAFAYAGGGVGVARFRETRVAPGVRAGVALGTRFGVRVEGRYQYLVGADDPSARLLAAGVHMGW